LPGASHSDAGRKNGAAYQVFLLLEAGVRGVEAAGAALIEAV